MDEELSIVEVRTRLKTAFEAIPNLNRLFSEYLALLETDIDKDLLKAAQQSAVTDSASLLARLNQLNGKSSVVKDMRKVFVIRPV